MHCRFKCLGVNRAGSGERRGPVTGRGSSGAPQVTTRLENAIWHRSFVTQLRCAYVGLESGAGGVAFGARKEEGSKISTTVEAAWALGCVPAARRRRPRAHQGVPALWRRPGRVDAAPSLFPVGAAASRSRGFRGPGRSSRRRDTPFPHGLEAVHRCSTDHELNTSPRHS